MGDFRDAIVLAGYVCAQWAQHDIPVGGAMESGSCSRDDVLSVYATEKAAGDQVARMKGFDSDMTLLVGSNWLLNAKPDAVHSLHARFGGTIVKIGNG